MFTYLIGALSSLVRALLRLYPHELSRYLAFAPRTVVYTARVNGDPLQDEDTGGTYAIPFDDAEGTISDVKLDYTIDIGTTPGGFDVGQFRLRKNPDWDGGIFYVGETAFSSVPVADNHYITIVAEHRIWQRRIRRVIAEDGLSYAEYFDYDIAYGGENDQFYPPIANITRDSTGNPYIPAGFFDPDESHRTIDLCSLLSFSPVNPITAQQWLLPDEATVVVGDVNSATIQIQLPAGYYEVRLSVLTAYGSAQRYASIWVFDPDDSENQPITNFSVTADQRSEGREMSFAVREPINLSVYPKGSPLCYWEEAKFGGQDAPDQYIRSFLGWATQNVTTFRLFRSIYSIKAGGPQSFLNLMYGFAQTVFDPQGDDTLWIHMPNNTPDKMVHYFLRVYTTALQVMNLYFSDYSAPIEGYTSDNGSVWSQITGAVRRYFGVAACDSIGSLYLVRHRSYLEQEERDALPPIIDLQKPDWTDDAPLELTADETEKYGLVDLYGSNYDIQEDGDHSHVWRVWAPGIVQGIGTQQDSGQPDIFLESSSFGETQLRRLAGYHLARLNNPRGDNSLSLKGNMDVFEVAWGLPITITYTDSNVRSESLNAQEFLIKSISVAHDNKPPFKKITLSIEQVTSGRSGINIEDVTQRDDVLPPSDLLNGWPPDYNGTDRVPTELIIFDSGTPQCHVALELDPISGDPIWVDVSTGLAGGGVIWWTADPWNYGRYFVLETNDGGGADGGLYRNDTPFTGGSWSLVASNATLFGDQSRAAGQVLMSINRVGYIAITAQHHGYIYSTDYGATWSRVAIGAGAIDWGHYYGGFHCHAALSTDNGSHGGWVYAFVAGDEGDWGYGNVYKSTDWGATWAPVFVPGVYLAGAANISAALDFPYMRSGGSVRNTNDANVELWLNGGGSLWHSVNDGLAFTGIGSLGTGTTTGWSLRTFTHDGNILTFAYSGGFAGTEMHVVFAPDASDLGSGVNLPNTDAEALVQDQAYFSFVNGFSNNQRAALAWSPIGHLVGKGFVYTLDSGQSWHEVSAPVGYVNVGGVEWSLRLLIPSPIEAG